MNPGLFDWLHWRIGTTFIEEFGFPCRRASLIANRDVLRERAVGWCRGESLWCRPKRDHVGVMFWNGRHFWIHLRRDEFEAIFGLTASGSVLDSGKC